MENTNNTNILENMIKIFEKLENSQFAEKVLKQLECELNLVSEYLDCTKIQAALFTVVFGLQNKNGNPVTFSMVVDYFGKNPLYFLKYLHDMNLMVEKELLNAKSEGQGNTEYLVCKSVFNSIIENKPITHNWNEISSFEIISDFYDLIFRFKEKKISITDFENSFRIYENRYAKNEIVNNIISEYPNDVGARIVVYSLCFRVMNQNDYQNDEEEPGFSYRIVPSRYYRTIKNSFEEKSHDLFVKNYVTFKYEIISYYSVCKGNTCKHLLLTQEGINKFFGSEKKNFKPEFFGNTEMSRLKEFFLEFSEEYEDHCDVLDKRFTLQELENTNKDLPFVKECKKLIPKGEDRFVLYDCCNDFVNFNSVSSLIRTLRDIYCDESEEQYSAKVHEYKDEKCFLIKEGFLFLNKEQNINKVTLEPADKVLELVYGKDADLYIKNLSDQNVIKPESLKEKTLFYSQDVLSQINMLNELLNNKNLVKMQERLESKGLPKGITVLLYGEPGTGKTESVYQLAKATNRKIFHVDISQTKSMWFGESEKIIKKVFVDYKNLCDSCARHNENIPILLFNEADAIISKRKKVDFGNTTQTENAIQNIILEQLENLNGIMIATTNLCDNIDSAFERRFLFKVKFNKPEIAERSKIWKNKLSWLSDEDAEMIARTYDFSGGEIDNIVRKCEIDEIIKGNIPDFAKVEELCKVEKFENKTNRAIGFEL